MLIANKIPRYATLKEALTCVDTPQQHYCSLYGFTIR